MKKIKTKDPEEGEKIKHQQQQQRELTHFL